MAINASLIAGAQIFRSDDRPLYHRGWTIIVGVLSFGVTSVLLLLLLYLNSNREITKQLRNRHRPDAHEDEHVEVATATSIEGVTILQKGIYNL